MVYRPGNRVKSDLTPLEAKEAYWKQYFEAKKGPLLRIAFHRIILDEAHIIKNHRGRTSEACLFLQGKYRWLLTGTPLSNCIEELYAYMAFLGCEEARSYELFKRNFCKRTDKSTSRIHALLLKIMLRRTGSDEIFGRPLINLPALAHETIALDFTPFEQATYDIVRTRFILRLNELSAQGQLQKQSKNIFTMLLRLRQICSHVMLVSHTLKDLLELEDLERLGRLTEGDIVQPQNNNDVETMTILRRTIARQVAAAPANSTSTTEGTVTGAVGPAAQTQLPKDLRLSQNPKSGSKFRPLLNSLRGGDAYTEIESRALCKKCREIPQRPRLTIPCGHLYCGECIDIMLWDPTTEKAKQSAICYECYQQFFQSQECEYGSARCSNRDNATRGDERRRRTGSTDSERSEHAWLNIRGAPMMSTKTQAIKATVRDWIQADPNCKCIIFTQFLGIIKVLQRICKWEGWGYCMFVGDMKPDARSQSIRDFREKKDKNIFISSMRAGSLGLNLTMAHKCIIVDPWWNESAEEQAFSRVFRKFDPGALPSPPTANFPRRLTDHFGIFWRYRNRPEDYVFAEDQATQVVQDDSDAELSSIAPTYIQPV